MSPARPAQRPLLSLVVPVYKEEGNVAPFLKRTLPVLKSLKGGFELIFCLDPSPDRTEALLAAAARKDRRIKLMVFSRRFGQPAATLAGMKAASGQTVAVIDIDMQDPPELLRDMVARWKAGAEVVTAKRRSRAGETPIKRLVSAVGYRIINSISDVPIPPDTGDYRLMSRRVVEQVTGLREKHGFLRGLVAFVGFRNEAIEFDRAERAEGEGKYNRHLGSLRIGFNGLVGFSNSLLNMTLLAGLAVSLLAVLGTAFMVTTRLILDIQYPLGVPTTIVLVLFLGGVQLVSIGILGQYIGRIYDEVRDRPTSIVERSINLPSPRG